MSFQRGHQTDTLEVGSLTNVGNPVEDLDWRNVIVGGCKIIYIEINSFVVMAVWAKQWNEIE